MTLLDIITQHYGVEQAEVYMLNQLYLPEDKRAGSPGCLKCKDTYLCTRPQGHTGLHVACGIDGNVKAEWS